MDESGVYGTRRDARRLARPIAKSGAVWMRLRPRCGTTVASWPAQDGDTSDRPGSARRKARKNRCPRTGDERCQARGTTPLCSRRSAAASSRTARRRAMRRLANGSRFALPGARRRLLGRATRDCSERSSEVFFAGVPGPASQRPRFSGPFAPGTRPRRGFGLRLWTHTSSQQAERQHPGTPLAYGAKTASRSMVTPGNACGLTIPP
jgi:hypothetical protein